MDTSVSRRVSVNGTVRACPFFVCTKLRVRAFISTSPHLSRASSPRRAPVGNVTGVQTLTIGLVGKHFVLLKESIPGFSRAGLLVGEHDSGEPEHRWNLGEAVAREAEDSGKVLGIRLQMIRVRRAEELDAAFSAFRAQRAQGLLLLRSPFMFTHRKVVVALAIEASSPNNLRDSAVRYGWRCSVLRLRSPAKQSD
jgi:hypothetical protein